MIEYMEQEEIWKDVVGYEGLYQVSNFGNVRSFNRVDSSGRKRRRKTLSIYTDRKGYLCITLRRNRGKNNHKIHRLVANAFIPNNDIFATTVNHKNEIKTDNRVENLEWMSPGDNTRYSLLGRPRPGLSAANYGSKNPRSKRVRCIETGEIFDCASGAARSLGQYRTAVTASIQHGYRCGGYHWEYVEKDKQTKQR